MELLNENDVRMRVSSAGVILARHESETGFYDDMHLSHTARKFIGRRPGQGELAFDLLNLLVKESSCGNAPHWILWLYGRVYTTDDFTIQILRMLSQKEGAGPAGTWDGYQFTSAESDLCCVITTIMLLAEWDLLLVPSHGKSMINIEHDGLVIYECMADPGLDTVSNLKSRFHFDEDRTAQGEK